MSKILTHNGHVFDFLDPSGSLAGRSRIELIKEISIVLSRCCRFGGHTRMLYTVAEHSVLVSQLVPSQYALPALLHDAHEAYVGDVSTPLKQLLPEYQMIETRAQRAVLEALGLDAEEVMHGETSQIIKSADAQALVTEARALMRGYETSRLFENVPARPLSMRMSPMTGTDAALLFLTRWRDLTGTPDRTVVSSFMGEAC